MPRTCGDAPPLPDTHTLKLHGPLATLGQHCNVFLDQAIEQLQAHPDELEFGCKSSIMVGGEASSVLQADTLGGSFEVVRSFETGHSYQGYAGEIRLALQTTRGWYVSDPILDVSAAGLQEHTVERLDLFARELHEAAGNEVIAVFANRVQQADPDSGTTNTDVLTCTVACRNGEAEPHCVALRTGWQHVGAGRDDSGALDVAFLPAGRVSISAGREGAGEALVGIRSW